jgi:GntR family transcriptional regulator
VWLENSKGGKDMIWIDYKDSRPIFEQIVENYEKLILHGAIEPNTKMPSIRKLAMELSLNPNTVQKAYAELERRGYTYTVKGKGVFVNYDPKQKAAKTKQVLDSIQNLVSEAMELGLSKDEIISSMNFSKGENK